MIGFDPSKQLLYGQSARLWMLLSSSAVNRGIYSCLRGNTRIEEVDLAAPVNRWRFACNNLCDERSGDIVVARSSAFAKYMRQHEISMTGREIGKDFPLLAVCRGHKAYRNQHGLNWHRRYVARRPPRGSLAPTPRRLPDYPAQLHHPRLGLIPAKCSTASASVKALRKSAESSKARRSSVTISNGPKALRKAAAQFAAWRRAAACQPSSPVAPVITMRFTRSCSIHQALLELLKRQ